ncbi:hypothetical protein NRC85_003766 [Vibrio parahaemolyticus]|nr:hypothetical protein [Vibrio parahaemolyticus]
MSNHLNKSRKIVESMRYIMGCGSFLDEFIHYWSFLQSEMYPPSCVTNHELFDTEFYKSSSSLTTELANVMLSGLERDPLAILLSEYSPNEAGGFYPTSSDITKLISSLMQAGKQQSQDHQSIFECCVGTGGLVFQQIIEIAERNKSWNNPLRGLAICVEDINPVAVKAFFIQFNFLLASLSAEHRKKVVPELVVIKCVNSLNQVAKGLEFVLLSPKEYQC